jgi:ABC-2 type transport system ATP-binding protein
VRRTSLTRSSGDALAKPLEVIELTKTFGSVVALREVSFAVEPGEVFGYLGPNGAGKTTTLRIVLGLVRSRRGRVELFGQPAGGAATRMDVGFIPGDLRLYGDMTGEATLDWFARFRPARTPRLRGLLLDALALDVATLKRRVKFLSHGTRQKLGLVVAMQHDPALLLLDEPSGGLDPLVQRSFRELVRDFARRGHAVLFSSHVLSEADDVCDRVAVLREGAIVAIESMASLRTRVPRRMTVQFRGPVPDSLASLPGVESCSVEGATAVLGLRGDINAVLRALAASDVQSVEFPEARLEDIFLGYYSTLPGPDA